MQPSERALCQLYRCVCMQVDVDDPPSYEQALVMVRGRGVASIGLPAGFSSSSSASLTRLSSPAAVQHTCTPTIETLYVTMVTCHHRF